MITVMDTDDTRKPDATDAGLLAILESVADARAKLDWACAQEGEMDVEADLSGIRGDLDCIAVRTHELARLGGRCVYLAKHR